MNNIEHENKKFKIPFSIGTNFDEQLIVNISKYNEDRIFKSVFGKLKSDFLGGGRASAALPEISMEGLKNYIKLCHDHHLKFNYLINPMCMENKELEADSHLKILKYIDELVNLGIDAITINSPYLCELIKKQFPSLKVSVGLYAYVHDLNLVRRWVNLGIDEITLAHDNNRNFILLEKMLLYTKDKDVSLRVIANNACLHVCPYAMMHGTVQSHTSQNSSNVRGDIDYCMMKCLSEKINNPMNLMSSDWIRPEDLKYYEDLCEKTGNYNLSIKLVERTKNTEFLTRVIKAYATRSYKGNLLDILLWPKMNEMLINEKSEEEINELSKIYDYDEFMKYVNIYNLPDVYIDNTKLDGFIERFIDNYECDQKICGGINDMTMTEGDKDPRIICQYCNEWSKKVISYDKKAVNKWVDNCHDFQEGLKKSKVFMAN